MNLHCAVILLAAIVQGVVGGAVADASSVKVDCHWASVGLCGLNGPGHDCSDIASLAKQEHDIYVHEYACNAAPYFAAADETAMMQLAVVAASGAPIFAATVRLTVRALAQYH